MFMLGTQNTKYSKALFDPIWAEQIHDPDKSFDVRPSVRIPTSQFTLR